MDVALCLCPVCHCPRAPLLNAACIPFLPTLPSSLSLCFLRLSSPTATHECSIGARGATLYHLRCWMACCLNPVLAQCFCSPAPESRLAFLCPVLHNPATLHQCIKLCMVDLTKPLLGVDKRTKLNEDLAQDCHARCGPYCTAMTSLPKAELRSLQATWLLRLAPYARAPKNRGPQHYEDLAGRHRPKRGD